MAAAPPYTRTGTRGVEETGLIVNDLRSNGYSVVGGVLSSKECQEAIDGMWDWLASLGSGITRDSPDTWGNNRWLRYCTIGSLKTGRGLVKQIAVEIVQNSFFS